MSAVESGSNFVDHLLARLASPADPELNVGQANFIANQLELAAKAHRAKAKRRRNPLAAQQELELADRVEDMRTKLYKAAHRKDPE